MSVLFDHVYLGTNYYADVGFVNMVENYDAEKDTVIRLGYHQMILPVSYRFIPIHSKWLNQHSLNLDNSMVLDPKGKLLDANQTALDAVGLRHEDVVGSNFWDIYCWSYSHDVQSRLKDAIESAARGFPVPPGTSP